MTLPDVNTQDPGVVSAYSTWIKALVQEFNIDGLRIDGRFYLRPCHARILLNISICPNYDLNSGEVSNHAVLSLNIDYLTDSGLT